jgi:hypothetical protein
MENDDFSDEEGAGSVPGHPDAPLPRRTHPQAVPSVTLPPFWMDNPAAWFALAESRFRMKGMYEEWDRYDCVISALSKESLRMVMDVITAPPDDDPYMTIKARLLSSHELTDYQRIEQLVAMDSLGSRRPSELLAHMLEVCPAGEERSKFFAFFFLQRLPQELRIMLGEDDHQEVHVMARKADKLWAIHGHRLHGGVAAVQQETQEPAVNALRGGGSGRGRRGGPPKQGGQSRQGSQNNKAHLPPKGAAAVGGTAPAALARESAGLCYFHWHFGDQAHKCEAPCSWQGN